MVYISIDHQIDCLTKPIISSVVFGTIFHGLDVLQGHQFSPRSAARNAGFIYVYHALICPMEALSGRRSFVHNMLSGGTLGYIGVASHNIGVPFLSPSFFYMNPRISPPLAGAAVYGSIAGALAGISGKSF